MNHDDTLCRDEPRSAVLSRSAHGRTTLGRWALALLLCATPAAFAACSDGVGGNGGDGGEDDGADDDGAEPSPQPQSIDAVDVLLVVDGSGSMADKQGFLAEAFHPFLNRLRNPRCVDAAGDEIDPQPLTVSDPCPAGSVRQYTPDVTVHVGVVSSSLGAAEVCDPSSSDRPLDDDGGRLVSRSPGSLANDLPTYQGLGFFAWDPAGRLAPAGESSFDAFTTNVTDAIRGVGEQGCGFEMPLEAMFRFLAEPHPMLDEQGAVDDVILQQRAAFLRQGSVLSVIVLSDENDASIRPEVEPLAAATSGMAMPRPRAECATDPGDACCVSCIEPVPAGCGGDGGCAAPGDQSNGANYYPSSPAEGELDESNVYLRTWESKRRFGTDFLQPVERYVAALSAPTVVSSLGTEEPNPVFAGGRDPRHVVYTAVVGVPWQDVAVDPADLTKGFQSPAEMRERGTWDVVLGDPATYTPASDPHMIESPFPRPGIAPYGAGGVEGDPINGGERETGYQDLQYACIFDLPAEDERDCSELTSTCDCFEGNPGNPVCDTVDPYLQIRTKAYPGLRQLDVAERLADQGRVVPICAVLLAQAAEEPEPGNLGSLGLTIGLGSVADDIASRMTGAAAE